MNNQATIQQNTVTVKHSGAMSRIVSVFDGRGGRNIDIMEINESGEFFDDELDLLREVVRLAIGSGNPDLVAVLDHVCETDADMIIEGVTYKWEQTKPIFAEVGFWNDD